MLSYKFLIVKKKTTPINRRDFYLLREIKDFLEGVDLTARSRNYLRGRQDYSRQKTEYVQRHCGRANMKNTRLKQIYAVGAERIRSVDTR